MKKYLLVAAFGGAFVFLQACADGSTDPIQSANETNEMQREAEEQNGAMANAPTERDSKFAVEAASGGMMEVQLGELAGQKATSARVKEFGAMMVRDHQQANEELKALAARKQITLPPAPGEDHMDEISDLTKKTGRDFDRAYIDLMVDDHEDDVEDFEEAARQADDPEIRAFAANLLPKLRQHLEQARAIREELRK